MRLLAALGAAVLLAALVATAAEAGTFRGHTTQSRTASVVTDGDGVPTRVRVTWAARCAKGTFAASTVFARLPEATRDHASETVRSTLKGAKDVRSLVTASVRLTRVVAGGHARWSGRFAARVTVRRGGATIDRCAPAPVGVRAA